MRLRHIAENIAWEAPIDPAPPFAPGWYKMDTIGRPEINPDSFHMQADNVTFIYTDDGLVWAIDEGDDISHYDVISMNPEFFDELSETGVGLVRTDMEEWALVGRVSPNKSYVAFWNESHQLHGMLGKCISELLAKDLINSDSHIVLLGFNQTTTASNTQNMGDPEIQTRNNPEKDRELQLRRDLHLMQPQEKKAAMKELGLSFGSRKNPWQKASEEAGLVQPGQKWWAPTSESRKDNHML